MHSDVPPPLPCGEVMPQFSAVVNYLHLAQLDMRLEIPQVLSNGLDARGTVVRQHGNDVIVRLDIYFPLRCAFYRLAQCTAVVLVHRAGLQKLTGHLNEPGSSAVPSCAAVETLTA